MAPDRERASDGIRRRREAPVLRASRIVEEPAEEQNQADEAAREAESEKFLLVKKFAPQSYDTEAEIPAEAAHTDEPVFVEPPRERFAAARRIMDFVNRIRAGKTEFGNQVPDSEIRERDRRWFVWGMFAGTMGLVALGIVLSTVFARLTVRMKPHIDDVSLQNVTAAFDASVSHTLAAQKVLPAEKLEFPYTASGDFDATGTQHIETYATGTVRVYNRFSSAPQKLVASTRFITDSGAVFRLPKNITIPGAAIEEGKIVPRFVDIELRADTSGEGSNIAGPLTLKIPGFKGTPKYDGFYGEAHSGFDGGFQGDARVISKDDLKYAEEAVTKQAFDGVARDMDGKIPPEFKRIDGLREIQITGIDAPPPNSRAERFHVSASAMGRTVVFRESDVVGLIAGAILKEDSAREVVPDSAAFTYQIRTVDFSKGRAEVAIQGSLKTRAVIAVEDLQDLIRGKKEGSVNEVLKGRSEIAAFSVSLFPPWLFSAPSSADKIRIVVDK